MTLFIMFGDEARCSVKVAVHLVNIQHPRNVRFINN